MVEMTVGSKAQVWHGTAAHTSGGLKKGDLVKNKHGRIVSRRKMLAGRKARIVVDGSESADDALDIEWLPNGHVLMAGPVALSFTGAWAR